MAAPDGVGDPIRGVPGAGRNVGVASATQTVQTMLRPSILFANFGPIDVRQSDAIDFALERFDGCLVCRKVCSILQANIFCRKGLPERPRLR